MAPVSPRLLGARNESGEGVTIPGGALTGQWLGDYQLQGLLGVGGMAEVYQARDAVLNRAVAIKVLPLALAADPSYVERFRNEANAVGALNHPNIVPVHHFGEQGPYLYLVMPLMKESLRDRLLRDVPLPVEEAVQIAVQILSGLGAAHAQGVVHRDVKPENILLDENGVARLTDFGIARRIAVQRGSGGPTLAGTGLPVGTPQYMAPEQLRGEDLDQRADIYALGSVLYEMLTGQPPHIADTPYEVASLVLTASVTPPSERNPAIWPELEQAMLRALNRKRADRYASATSFAEALQDALLAHDIELIEPASAVKSSYVKFRTSQPVRNRLTGPPEEQDTELSAAAPKPQDTEPMEPPTPPIGDAPPAGKPPRWPPSNRPREDGAGSGGPGRRTLIIALIAAVVLLATCGAGVLGVNLLTGGGTTTALGAATSTSAPPTETLAPTTTTGPGTPTSTPAPTNTSRPGATATNTQAAPTPTRTPTPPVPSLSVSGPGSMPAYSCGSNVPDTVFTVTNIGAPSSALHWSTTVTPPHPLDVFVVPPSGTLMNPPSGPNATTTVTVSGNSVVPGFTVTFKNDDNPSQTFSFDFPCS
jgi:serine/threonine-protein kinase